MDSKWLKISLVAILIAGAIFVYYAYTTASTIDTLKAFKTATSKWNPYSDIIAEIVNTIINIIRKACGVV